MYCTKCGAWSDSPASSQAEAMDGNAIIRWRTCANGHKFSTIEINEAVVRAIGESRVAEAIATLERGRAARGRAARIAQTVLSMRSDGRSVAEIAKAVGRTDARVRQILAKNSCITRKTDA